MNYMEKELRMQHLENIINSGLLEGIKKKDYMNAFEELSVSMKKYRKNATIFFTGDIVDKICLIESGSVRGEKTYANGELHIVSVFEEGSLFGLEIAASRSRESAIDFISNEDSTILFISMNSIEKSNYAKQMHKVLSNMLADENIKLSHKIEILAQRGLRERILVYLSVLRNKSGSNTVTIKMSREQLAQYLCVNRSALSNELHKMKKEGIIDFKGQKFTLK